MDKPLCTHVGICVSDLDRSLPFYRDVLGFQVAGALDLEGEHVDALNELEGVKLRTVFLEQTDGQRIELLAFREPGWTGPQAARPMNQVGLTHLAFRVDDLEAACERIEAAGGALLPGSRMELPDQGPARAIMALDPDGLRIELLQRPGSLRSIPTPRGSRIQNDELGDNQSRKER